MRFGSILPNRRLAVAGIVAGVLLAAPGMTGDALAATQTANNPYAPESVCKKPWSDREYKIVDHMTLAGGKAVTYLLRNDDGAACAVTMKQGEAVGNSTTIGVWIDTPGDGGLSGDTGEFKYYAGPVDLYLWPCVHWGGRYGGDTVKKTPCD